MAVMKIKIMEHDGDDDYEHNLLKYSYPNYKSEIIVIGFKYIVDKITVL